MEVKNNLRENPFSYYLQLFKEKEPEDGKAFHITFLSDDYEIEWPEYKITSKNEKAFALNDLKAQTFILRVITAENFFAPMTGFKTFREMPWGETYVEPFNGRCLTRAAFSFGTCMEKFKVASEKIGARKLDRADAAYEFEVMPGYFIQLHVWEGDDEFPPNSQMFFSDNFAVGLTAEDRVIVAEMLITFIKNTMKEM